MAEHRTGERMKPPVFFPAMGNPLESEIRRVEFDAAGQVRAEKRGKTM